MSTVDEKTKRVFDALERREPDRVPIGEFFWTNFVRRAREELGAGDDFNPYTHWDLDLIVVNPNMDPHLTGIQVLEDTPERKVVKTGFGATIERRADYPMPYFHDFSVKTWEDVDNFRFDDATDPSRFHEALDDQINAVADTLLLGLPPWFERLEGVAGDFCAFGGICEPHEMIWRIMGSENVLYKMVEDTARLGRFVERIGDFLADLTCAQIEAAGDRIKGFYIWGDVAYVNGMLFSPALWRSLFKPQLQRLCEIIHEAGLKVIYHGCGDARAVFEDMIEIGVDAYNPLEAKAGLDVVELKRTYGDRWSFNGNLDVRELATNDRDRVRAEVLRKLNAAKGGGYIIQSDHSVPSNVSGQTYDYVVELVRRHGVYPLDLGEFDEDVSQAARKPGTG